MVVDDVGAADTVLAAIMSPHHLRYIATDAEWPTAPTALKGKRIALVQVAIPWTAEGMASIYLFRISSFRKMPQSLKNFLECEDIVKVGLNIAGENGQGMSTIT